MTAAKRPDPAVWETPVMRKALAAHDFATATAYKPVTDIAVLRRIVAGLGIPPGYVGLACCTCPHYDGDDL